MTDHGNDNKPEKKATPVSKARIGRKIKCGKKHFASMGGKFDPKDPDEEFLNDWNKSVGRPPKVLHDILNEDLPENFKIKASFWRSDDMRLQFTLNDSRGREIMQSTRSFEFDEKTVSHDRLVVSSRAHGRGVARVFLRNSMRLYRALGIEKVEVTAAMSNGGYTWARFGFRPDQDDWDRLRSKMEDKLAGIDDAVLPQRKKRKIEAMLRSENPEAIWLIAELKYEVDGTTLGKKLLTGTNWSGTLDLKDRKQMRRFWAYVNKIDPDISKALDRGKKAPDGSPRQIFEEVTCDRWISLEGEGDPPPPRQPQSRGSRPLGSL